MDLIKKLSPFVFLILFLHSSNAHGNQANLFKVTDFGAISDGKTDNSAAFLKTWSKACETNGGGVLVPSGTFLLKKASFEGPCEGETHFQVTGNLVANPDPELGSDYWIQFRKVDGLKLVGSATFDGQGALAWQKNNCSMSSTCERPPESISVANLKNSEISGIKSLNSKGVHIVMTGCDNMVVHDILISAPASSPNTDGIHIERSNDIKIMNSKISTGDDCVSLGDGNTNINITGVHCGPGHGISIGSLGKNVGEKSVIGVSVTNCTFTNTDNGLRIKTWARPTGQMVVSNIMFAHIIFKDSRNPIIIDQFYCPHSRCDPKGESSVAIQGVKFIDVRGTSATDVSVSLQCSKVKPCQDIELSDVELKMSGTGQNTKAACLNAKTTFAGERNVPASC